MTASRTLLGSPLHEPDEVDQYYEAHGQHPDERNPRYNEALLAIVRSSRAAETPPSGVHHIPGDQLVDRYVTYMDRFDFVFGLAASISTRETPYMPYTATDVPALVTDFHSKTAYLMQRTQDRGLSFDEALLLLSAKEMTVEFAGLNAPTFFMDSDTAAMTVEAIEPDTDLLADLRLPGPAVNVILANPIFVPPDSAWWSEEERELAHTRRAISQARGHDAPFGSDIVEFGAHITGVTFFADNDGFLLDTISWMLEVQDDTERGPARDLHVGSLSQSALAPILYNLAAVIAWGDWTDPGEPDPRFPTDSSTLDAVKNKGWFRRATRSRPEHFGVRTLNRAAGTDARNGSPEPSGRTVKAHLRRGHWRSVRIATRDENNKIVGDVHGTHGTDWHYEGRWVPPTVVNQRTAHDSQIAPAVYVIPEPDWYQDTAD